MFSFITLMEKYSFRKGMISESLGLLKILSSI